MLEAWVIPQFPAKNLNFVLVRRILGFSINPLNLQENILRHNSPFWWRQQ
jgi:hypothetical protein